MQKLRQLFILSILFTCSVPILAEGVLKLGFVNTERVYRDSKTAKSVQKKIEQEFSERRARLQDMEKEGVKIQKQLTRANLNPQDRMRLEREFSALDRDYRAATEELTLDYTLKRNEEFAAVQTRANQLLKEMAEKGNFDLILQDAVYVKPQYDLTDALIKALDK